jgi:hypothetical protein
VQNAVHELKVVYPIAIDSKYRIWNAFKNEYWPAQYLMDAKGRIRYHHFGEGDYGEIEGVIRELLKENGATGVASDTTSVSAVGIEAAPDWTKGDLPKSILDMARSGISPGPKRCVKIRSSYTALPCSPR